MGMFGFDKKGNEYDFIYGRGAGINEVRKGKKYTPSYEEVYDEDGDNVYCDYCGMEIKWKDGQYVCSNCDQIMSREVFFNYIGAEPPGNKCITCDNLYPGCVVCPHGYVDD